MLYVPPTRRFNRAGIPVFEINTSRVPAAYFSDGKWVPTTTVIKYIKNR